jgi:hypothetical protein
LENWEDLKEFLRSTFTEKRTLDSHVSQFFKAKQNRTVNISVSIQKIQTLGSKFRESAMLNCGKEEQARILNLPDNMT